MKTLIIEDEPVSANELVALVKQHKPEAQLYPVLDTVVDAIAFFENEQPDIVFLDIELADGNAFQIFDQVDIECPIVFTTAYNEYALKAFEVNGIDYLLKPITTEKVSRALNKFHKMNGSFQKEQLTSLLQAMSSQSLNTKYKDSFLVKSGNRLYPIPCERISYFFAEEKWVYLVTDEGKQNIINYTLTDLESLLNPNDYFRLNRQYIISRNMVDSLEGYVKGQVMAYLKKGLPPQVVSRKQTRLLKKWLS